MITATSLTAAMTTSGGLWRVTPSQYHDDFAVVDEAGLLVLDGRSGYEAHAIVRVRNSVPDLLDETKRLTAAVAAARELHRPVDVEPSDTICVECSFQLPNGHYLGKIVEWPCPTIRALDADA